MIVKLFIFFLKMLLFVYMSSDLIFWLSWMRIMNHLLFVVLLVAHKSLKTKRQVSNKVYGLAIMLGLDASIVLNLCMWTLVSQPGPSKTERIHVEKSDANVVNEFSSIVNLGKKTSDALS